MSVDHVAQMLGRLPAQLRGKPRIAALLTTWGGEVQAVEDALQDLLTLRSIETGFGQQLDDIGGKIGEPRSALGGTDDTTYKRRLRARVLVNKSNGSFEDVIAVVRAIVDLDDLQVVTAQERVATVSVLARGIAFTGGSDDLVLAELVLTFLRRTVLAGVRVLFGWTPADDDETFTMAVMATLDGALAGGESVVPVQGGLALPGAGTITIDSGLASEESLVYTMRTDTAVTLGPAVTVAGAHVDGAEVVDANSVGLGFGDSTNSSTGGDFASVME